MLVGAITLLMLCYVTSLTSRGLASGTGESLYIQSVGEALASHKDNYKVVKRAYELVPGAYRQRG